MNRIWFLFVIITNSYQAIYFDIHPVWAVAGTFVILPLPWLFDFIVTIHEAVKYNNTHKTPGNRIRKLRGLLGGFLPIYDE